MTQVIPKSNGYKSYSRAIKEAMNMIQGLRISFSQHKTFNILYIKSLWCWAYNQEAINITKESLTTIQCTSCHIHAELVKLEQEQEVIKLEIMELTQGLHK